MKFQLIFEKETFVSFQESIDYYNEISTNIREKFEVDFWNKIQNVKENPYHYQVRYKNIRVAFTDVFSFGYI